MVVVIDVIVRVKSLFWLLGIRDNCFKGFCKLENCSEYDKDKKC